MMGIYGYPRPPIQEIKVINYESPYEGIMVVDNPLTGPYFLGRFGWHWGGLVPLDSYLVYKWSVKGVAAAIAKGTSPTRVGKKYLPGNKSISHKMGKGQA